MKTNLEIEYQQILEKIASVAKFPKKPGLTRIKKLLDLMGNPQNNLKFVHVAGTNGKGTTCSYISSVLKESEYKTGLFTSPYVIDFTERFQINGEMISKKELINHAKYVFSFVNQLDEITEFEFITAVALNWFCKEKCDIVVLEVGLGGRFDATNIIENPLVSVITSISLDHTKILGDTVELIAAEKAGIIKQNSNVVCYSKQKDSVKQIIKATCHEKNASLTFSKDSAKIISETLDGSVFETENLQIKIPFCGEHQIYNALTAFEALKILRNSGFNISKQNLLNGFEKASIVARMEILSHNPLVILDGSHNSGGGFALQKLIHKHIQNTEICGIIGMVEDKDYRDYLALVAPCFKSIICLEPNSPRALKADKLSEFARLYCKDVSIAQNSLQAVEMAFDSKKTVVACGSLYLASQLRELIIEKVKNFQNSQ